jgi:Transposase
MSQPNDSNKSVIPLEQDNTMIAVIEMGQASWLVAAIVPGLERQPLKKLGSDEQALLQLLQRWRNEAVQAGRPIKRLVIAYEAGRDGFWLARWLRARDIEAYVIHPNSVAVSREHRRAKTDRLDTELLKRAFLGWLRGEARHCSMAAIPTIEEEDARRPNREHENLVGERTRIVNRMKATLARFGIRRFKFTLRHADGECQKFCVSDFCEGGFEFSYIATEASTARSASLLGRIERSSPNAAPRRAEGAGLDGDGADQAIIDDVVMSIVFIIVLPLENGRRIGWRTGPWRRSIQSLVASADRRS